MNKIAPFDRLLSIMDELREKCPWDQKQTMESLSHLTIEETYELVDSVLDKDMKEIKGELGDLLLHIVFYSKIASETNDFDIIDVINSRFPGVENTNEFKKKIYSITHYNSLVSFKINSKKSINATTIKNTNVERVDVVDFRTNDYFPRIDNFIRSKLPSLRKIPVIKKVVRYLFYTHNFVVRIRYYLKIKKFFK